MPKMLLHQDDARLPLGRGVAKLTRAVAGTLGPRGMNAIVDVPIGTPIVSRDGASIASEIELECRFENMGAQVVREVSKQTNEVAGDGTTTATVLADAMVQAGLELLARGVNAFDVVRGIKTGVEVVTDALKEAARPLESDEALKAVAAIAANDAGLGELVAEAFIRVGSEGTVDVEHGLTVETTLEVTEGMTFDRGYISHHMVTDVEKMQAVLDEPCILMTDQKITSPEEIAELRQAVADRGRSLLIVAEELSTTVIVSLFAGGAARVAAVHSPEFGHWRKAMLEDLAILTGGRVIARDLGGKVAEATPDDLGTARRVRIAAGETTITGGGGDPEAIAARRVQITRQLEAAPHNIERDKFVQRLAKLSGGSAVVLAGGATPVEQRRRGQLIEDSLNAVRAAVAEGVVPGGGVALVQAAPALDSLISIAPEGERAGVELLQRILGRPLRCIAENSGADADDVAARVAQSPKGTGFNARSGQFEDLIDSGIMDPAKVCCTALRNAASVASLILTTHTLIADKPEYQDPTAGRATGGGSERLGRD